MAHPPKSIPPGNSKCGSPALPAALLYWALLPVRQAVFSRFKLLLRVGERGGVERVACPDEERGHSVRRAQQRVQHGDGDGADHARDGAGAGAPPNFAHRNCNDSIHRVVELASNNVACR